MIPLSSSCIKLVYVLVISRATRSLFWTLGSECCGHRPNYGNRGFTVGVELRKSGGAEQSDERALKKNNGAGGGSRSGNGAEVTGLG